MLQSTLASDHQLLVYIVCKPDEPPDIQPVESYLKKEGFGILKLSTENPGQSIAAQHQTYLKSCDGAILFSTDENIVWVKRMKSNLERKAAGYRVSGQPAIAIFAYQNTSTFGPEKLTGFLAKLGKIRRSANE